MKYRISEEAGKDLEKIWMYTLQNWSIEKADSYLKLIFNKREAITKKPSIGVNYNKLIANYYYARVKSHLIFYKINTESNTVDIIRILHNHMDVINIISSD